jgi:hypothetical protein
MTSTPVLSDSTCTISIARDPVKHELTKYIGVDAFYTQVQAQVIVLQYVPSELQLADFFTKAQTRAQHDRSRVKKKVKKKLKKRERYVFIVGLCSDSSLPGDL